MRKTALAILALTAISTGYADDEKPELSGSALIDHWVSEKWEAVGIKPVTRSDDAEFLRRVYLDTVGVVPSADEAKDFLADRSRDKRAKLVAKLVKDPRYATHWADVWSGILVGFDNEQQTQGNRSRASEELRELFAKNAPYDELARAVITTSGELRFYRGMRGREADMKKEEDGEESGLVSYIVREFRKSGREDLPMAMAGHLTKAFMGVQIQCAQCHDHPFDRWTQEEFYGMASFFSEVQVRPIREQAGEGKPPKLAGYTVADQSAPRFARRPGMMAPENMTPEQRARMAERFLSRRKDIPEDRKKEILRRIRAGEQLPNRGKPPGGDLKIPGSDEAIKAAFLQTGEGAKRGQKRRETFASYMTSKDNLQFAKMAVNRYWGHYFGRGIVDPVDDFNAKNRPSHPELLDALAKDFIAHGYDIRWLIGAIAGSEAYQLTSRARERDTKAERYFAVAQVRALSPEQILRSVLSASGIGAAVQRFAGGNSRQRERMIFGITRQFRFAFGDDEGSEVTEFAGSIPSALMMMNSDILGRATSTEGRMSPLSGLIRRYPTADERLRAIYLACLSRMPTSKEVARWKPHVLRSEGPDGYEDLLWTLLNSSEFLFNH